MKTRWQAATEDERERERAQTRRAQAERRAEIRAIIEQAKARPCSDCGRSYPGFVMDLDHVRGEKSFSLSKAVQRAFSVTLDEIRAEIAKCDVVCANCHRIRTAAVHYPAMRIARRAENRNNGRAA
jgi:hypothetical protein